MEGAIAGITTIWLVIAVGYVVAHLGLVDQAGRRLLSMMAFNVGSPALLFGTVARASLDHMFAFTVVVSALATAAAGIAYLLLAAFVFRPTMGGRVIGFMASSYTNAANFGLAIALAFLGDATWMAPILLMQVAIIMPTCLALLDIAGARAEGRKLSVRQYITLPFRNPITVGIVLGLIVNLAHIPVPDLLWKPITMVGSIAVPLMLIAFGVSLRLDPRPGSGSQKGEMWATVFLKVIFHPLAAYLIGRALGLGPHELYAVTVLGALPAAQNVHIMASRYGESELLGRDAVFYSTILSMFALLGIAALLSTSG